MALWMTASVRAIFIDLLIVEELHLQTNTNKKAGPCKDAWPGLGLSNDDHRGRRGCGQGTAITTSSTVTQISMAEEAIIDATQVTL